MKKTFTLTFAMLLFSFGAYCQTPSLSGSGSSTALTITWPSAPSCAPSTITSIALNDPATGSTIANLSVASSTATTVTSTGSLLLSFLDPDLDYDILLVHPTCAPFVTQIANTPLPVEFVDVTVNLDARGIKINWSTASEHNNEKFIVEQSYDGEVWTDIAIVDGAGNSNELLSYSTVDTETSTSVKSFFRIRQIDYDGTNDVSDIVRFIPSETTLKVYPNPSASNTITLNGKNIDELDASNIKVTNMAGKNVEFNFDSTTHRLEFDVLVDGLYIIDVNGQKIRFVKL